MTYAERLEAAIIVQLRVEIAERNINQQELAKLVGTYPATMNRYFRGHRHIPMETFIQVARAFGMTPSALMALAESRMDQAPAVIAESVS